MNFYNPYMYTIPEASTSIFSKITFQSILNGASKTLNVINQAIPVVKQISPIMKNAKTMFKVLNEFKKSDSEYSKKETIYNDVKEENKQVNNSLPTFFI